MILTLCPRTDFTRLHAHLASRRLGSLTPPSRGVSWTQVEGDVRQAERSVCYPAGSSTGEVASTILCHVIQRGSRRSVLPVRAAPQDRQGSRVARDHDYQPNPGSGDGGCGRASRVDRGRRPRCRIWRSWRWTSTVKSS